MNSEDRKYITFALPLIKQLYLEPTKAIQQIKLFAINAKAQQYNLTVDNVVEEETDNEFVGDAYMFARRQRAAKDMGMDLPKCEDWNLIEPFSSLYSGQVPVSISLERLEGWNIKTEYDRVKLGVYMAVRSLAKDCVAVTTQQAIKWRSLGCKNGQEFQQALHNNQLQAIADKWHTRYYFAKILADLQDSRLILTLSRCRHTFVSASILDEDAFIEAAIDKIRHIYAKAKEKQMSAQRKRMNNKWNEISKKGLDGIKDLTPEKIEPKKKEQHIEKEDKTPYEKQLQDKRWKDFRNFVFAVRGKKCEICGGTHVLQVHHPKYIAGRKAWEYPVSEVQVLCRHCHQQVHNLE